jgi:hypothetical protein
LEIFASQNQQSSLKLCHLFWTFEIFPKPLNGMSGSTMYFHSDFIVIPTGRDYGRIPRLFSKWVKKAFLIYVEFGKKWKYLFLQKIILI